MMGSTIIGFSLKITFIIAVTAFTAVNADFVHFQPEQVHLSLTEKGNIVVTWSTENETSSQVEFGQNASNLTRSVEGQSRVFTDGGSEKRSQYVHRVILPDLEPNRVFYYHVGSEKGWSPLFFFLSSPLNSPLFKPRLAIFGDLGNANAQSLPRLQRESQDLQYDLIFHVGDFAYDLDSNQGRIGDEFMRQLEPVAAYVPYMTCPGNHEQKYNFSHYKHRFNMPKGDEMFYSIDVGPVHFISINTEYYYFLNYGIKMVAKQYEWIVKDLEKANLLENRHKRPWIIMLGHRPMYCSDTDQDDCTRRDTFTRVGLPILKMFGLEELLMRYNVDMAIWGHEHDYERFWPLYDYTVMNGSYKQPYTNPKAPVQLITGSAGCQERHDAWQPLPDITAFRSMDYGYTRLMAHNSSHLEIEQVSDDKNGQIIDHWWIVNHNHDFKVNQELNKDQVINEVGSNVQPTVQTV